MGGSPSCRGRRKARSASLFGHRLSLDEQFVERRMLPVCVVRRQREFDVARQIELAGPERTIDQRHSPDLDVIFRGDDNLGFALNPVIDAPEHGPVEREVGGIALHLPAGRLIGVAPQPVRVDIMDVTERSPRIPGPIRSPACDLKVTPAAVAAAGVRQHQAIAAIAEQLGLGRGGMGRFELAHRRRDFADGRNRRDPGARRDLVQRRKVRNAFMKQWLDRAHARVVVEMVLDGIAMEEIGQRQESHSLMMGHIGSHDHPALPFAGWLLAEVHCFVIAVIVQQSQLGQSFEIVAGFLAVRYSSPEGWHRAR